MTNRADEFWAWFAPIADDLAESFDAPTILEELDRRIMDLGNYAWEIGPGLREENALVISPGGDRNLLTATREIVAQAPAIEGWEFHPAKPPKRWNLVFDMDTGNESQMRIDASKWRCALRRDEEGDLEVVIEAPNLADLDEEHRRWAGEIVLDGILGEETRLETIDRVEVVVDERLSSQAIPIDQILDALCAGSPTLSPDKTR
jgi:hypothetical protein